MLDQSDYLVAKLKGLQKQPRVDTSKGQPELVWETPNEQQFYKRAERLQRMKDQLARALKDK